MKQLLLPILLLTLQCTLSAQNCNDTQIQLQSQTQDWGEEMSWQILNELGEEIAAFQGEENEQTDEQEVCLTTGCYTVIAADSYGDGWNGGSLRISIEGGETIDYTLEEGSLERFAFGIQVPSEGCVPIVQGCTNAQALNYNPEANLDDGTCTTLSELIAETTLDTVFYHGSKDNRINWVIQNRGVGNPDGNFESREQFLEMLEADLVKAFTYGDPAAQIPYAQYQNFFNLYASWWEDAPSDQEWWHFSIIKQMRDELFLPWSNDETGWVSWFSTTKNGGGGGAGLQRERRVGDAKIFGMGYETFLHEFGHTMPGLLDEYSASGVWSGGQCWETPNTTANTNIDDIPWRLWIEEGTPLPTPYTEEYLDKYGAFEGAMTNFFGCHRPTARGCYMGAGGFGEGYGLDLCGPCRQRIICFLYKYVNVIENPQPAQNELQVTGNQTMTFSAEVLKPEPNTQKYEWFLNGRLIAEGVEEVELTFGTCDAYELTFAVTDTNTMVRYDPKFEETYPKPYRAFTWTIEQTDVENYSLIAQAVVQNPDCTGEINGQVAFEAGGGAPPYTVLWEGKEVGSPINFLAAGDYTFDIVDANGCSVSQTVTLQSDALLEPQLCSAYENGAWNLWVETPNYDLNSLTFNWSNGETGAAIEGLPNGNYSVEITTSNNCSLTEAISLSDFEAALTSTEKVLTTQVGKESGQIHLDIQGGLPPYTVTWTEKRNQDITDANNDYITASGTTWDHLPEYAFDNSLDEKWLHFVSENAWISYHIPEGAVVNYYTITSADDVPQRDPKHWLFEGSNDGENWVVLDERTNESFNSRFQKRGFLCNNSDSYTYYRFYVLENHGDGSIQLQQLEFIGTKNGDSFTSNPDADNQTSRLQLGAGAYAYTVKDVNLNSFKNTLTVGYSEPFSAMGLQVVQKNRCSVAIENPHPDYDYYWLSDESASEILQIGTDFPPPASGNYYVAAVERNTKAMSENRKGFAITLQSSPEIETLPDNTLGIVNPQSDMDYHWYDAETCAEPIHIGTTYTPTLGTGIYYATAQKNTTSPTPIHPRDISGMVHRMDASDLDGDGLLDDPAPATSSTLGWFFETGGQWQENNWFAFRSNYQNGLGVVDFATIWLQSLEFEQMPYQTIVMAYQENAISFPNTAPFNGLTTNIPRHDDESQLFTNNAPARVLEGSTFLNGELVNPLETANPLNFSVLGVRMTELSDAAITRTDTRWEGKLGELILWNRALTDAEMEGISAYLHQKWVSVADLESPKTGVFWEDATDVEKFEMVNKVQLFPNPVVDVLEVKGLIKGEMLQLLGMDGRVLRVIEVTSSQVRIQMIDLESGVYLLKGGGFVEKVVKLE